MCVDMYINVCICVYMCLYVYIYLYIYHREYLQSFACEEAFILTVKYEMEISLYLSPQNGDEG